MLKTQLMRILAITILSTALVGMSNATSQTSFTIPQRVIECEILDVKSVSDETGEMVDSHIKRLYLGSKIMLNIADGSFLSPMIPLTGFSAQVIDDGQSSGQWFKALYVGLPALTPKGRITGNALLMVVSYDVKLRLKFNLTDATKMYSGKCK
jgi:hypothetical protein